MSEDGTLSVADITKLLETAYAAKAQDPDIITIRLIMPGSIACPSCQEDALILIAGIAIFGMFSCLICGTYFDLDGPTGHVMDERFRQDVLAGLKEPQP